MKNNDMSSDFDRMLRERMHSELPQPGCDEWFTRKVMNRLPDKHTSSVSWIENLGFLIAGVVLVVMWIMFGRSVLSAGAVTFVDILVYGAFIAMAVALAVGMLRPFRN